jgi:uncharacterized iron-regulated membrane protein
MDRPAARNAGLRRSGAWALLHRWLGLGLGLWFVLVGLSGALLVWRDELDAALNPQWFHAPGRGAALPLEDLLARLRGEEGLGWVERIRLPREAGQALRLQVRAGPARVEVGRIEVFVDPTSGAVLGTRSLERLGLNRAHGLRTLYELHRNVLLGEPGSNFVGSAGLLLLASATSGIVLAWPRTRERLRRLLAVGWRANTARLALDLHRSTGVLIGALLLLSTLTGATLVWLNPVRAAVSLVSRVEPIPVLPFRTQRLDDEALPLDELKRRVQAAFAPQQVAEIRLPERGGSGVMFQLRAADHVHRSGDTIVWAHPISGDLVAERSTRTRSGGEALMHWLLPLHVGSAFGGTGLVLMAAAGSAPLLLLGSGGWLWWVKRRKRRAAPGPAAADQAAGNA